MKNSKKIVLMFLCTAIVLSLVACSKNNKKSSKENHFGTKHTYTLEDSEGNLYVWETGARDYPTNASVSLKMKVKEHKEINGEQCTIVWYCKQI